MGHVDGGDVLRMREPGDKGAKHLWLLFPRKVTSGQKNSKGIMGEEHIPVAEGSKKTHAR